MNRQIELTYYLHKATYIVKARLGNPFPGFLNFWESKCFTIYNV
jgi:hypothetical protein